MFFSITSYSRHTHFPGHYAKVFDPINVWRASDINSIQDNYRSARHIIAYHTCLQHVYIAPLIQTPGFSAVILYIASSHCISSLNHCRLLKQMHIWRGTPMVLIWVCPIIDGWTLRGTYTNDYYTIDVSIKWHFTDTSTCSSVFLILVRGVKSTSV